MVRTSVKLPLSKHVTAEYFKSIADDKTHKFTLAKQPIIAVPVW